MLAVGMVYVVVIRDIDLSIGWILNLSAIAAAVATVNGIDPFIAAAIGIATGGLLGLINGVLAVGLRMPVIIITLGTAYAYRGLALVVTGSHAVAPTDVSSPFFGMWDGKLFNVVPSIAVAFLILAVVMHILLHKTRFGYRVQAMGSNPDAARLAGIPVEPDPDHGPGADGRWSRVWSAPSSWASDRRSTRPSVTATCCPWSRR